jgi:lysophospholipase L1-like esterase
MRNSNLLVAISLFLGTGAGRAAEPFELKEGDRVVLVGNTLIEREQRYGYWEAALTSRWPDRNITFRNLGWSGDTVWGESRAGFGSQADGFKKLVKDVLDLKPTVLIIGYGGVEAFESPARWARFQEGLRQLLDALAPANARIILLSPTRLEYVGQRGNDPAAVNKNVAFYRYSVRFVAAERGHRYLDLFDLPEALRGRPLTDNGQHLGADGYRLTAAWIEKSLGWPERANRLSPAQAEKLRQAIIAKNEQFFHRWRPQNVTYLFGFRKHEQGKNAVEIPQFDPIVEKLEKEIARLRKPVPHVYELK